ncbi:MAG: hypothetical protein L0H63_13590 [Nitrococcus sp.]|nr:hypothetical protein [Nitrococcus sp.]
MIYVELAFFLILILIAALIFTNALEHLGARIGISEGVTGSIFAAVGTAMPETMIPILALFFGSGGEGETSRQAIGVGAILGAPLLLSTLAMFLMAVAVVFSRKPTGTFEPERSGLRRDLNFFLIAFGVATVALFIPHSMRWLDFVICAFLVALYPVYIWFTVRASAALVEGGHGTEADNPLLLSRLALPTNMPVILVQIAVGLVILVVGAEGFIHSIESLSDRLGISALILSLLIAPLASEMPEKVNSIIWVRRKRDTLAFGNVTGAMVFQGSLLPALGILTTPWQVQPAILGSVLATLIAAVWLRLMLMRGYLRVWQMVLNGALYAGYIVTALTLSGWSGAMG